MKYPTVAVSRLALREGHAKKPIYTMHKWWARRLGTIFRMLLLAETAPPGTDEDELWRRFYDAHSLPEGFTVLDPFLGGGTTLVEAAKLGANCIGIDIDPVACFVTRMELTSVDPTALQRRYQEIDEAVGEQIRTFYRSRVDGEGVDVVYFFWVDRITCPDCGEAHDGHPTYQVAHYRETERQIVVCPQCDRLADRELNRRRFRCGNCHATTDLEKPPVRLGKFHCPTCGTVRALHELYRENCVEQRLFAQEYVTAQRRGFAATSSADERLFRQAAALYEREKKTWPIPDAAIPSEGRSDSRPLLYGYTHYHQLFNPRQLACLGLIADEVRRTPERDVRMALALAFSHCLASNNMFCGYAFGYRRLTPLFSVHSYRKISRPVEGNVWGLPAGRGSFRNAVRNVLEGQDYLREPFEYRYRGATPLRVPVARPDAPAGSVVLLNRGSEDLSPVPTGSVDLVLTDPPYFDNLSYSELSDFYHVWLRRLLGKDYPGHDREHTPLRESLFAGRRGSEDGRERYTETLTQAFRECRRVAREGAAMIFTYHHRSPEAWASVGAALLTAGFRVEDVFPVRSEGKSGLHSYAGSIKWDSVLRCRRAEPMDPGEAPPEAVEGAVKSAKVEAAAWRRRLTASRLIFTAADAASLAMSLVLKEFSDRELPAASLLAALVRVVISSKSGKARQKSR